MCAHFIVEVFFFLPVAAQVRTLVQEVEEARGGLGSTSFSGTLSESRSEVSSSDEVISSRLVAFR